GRLGEVLDLCAVAGGDQGEHLALVARGHPGEDRTEQLLLGGEVVHQPRLGDAGGAGGGVEGERAALAEMGLGGVEHRLAGRGAVRGAARGGGDGGACGSHGTSWIGTTQLLYQPDGKVTQGRRPEIPRTGARLPLTPPARGPSGRSSRRAGVSSVIPERYHLVMAMILRLDRKSTRLNSSLVKI